MSETETPTAAHPSGPQTAQSGPQASDPIEAAFAAAQETAKEGDASKTLSALVQAWQALQARLREGELPASMPGDGLSMAARTSLKTAIAVTARRAPKAFASFALKAAQTMPCDAVIVTCHRAAFTRGVPLNYAAFVDQALKAAPEDPGVLLGLAAGLFHEERLGVFEGRTGLLSAELSATLMIERAARLLARRPARAADLVRYAEYFPFFAAYGQDDVRALNEAFNRIFQLGAPQSVPSVAPAVRASGGGSSGKTRIGFLTTRTMRHSVFKIPIRGWLRLAEYEDVELHVCRLGGRDDPATQEIRERCDVFHEGVEGLENWAEYIRGLDLDVALFPDIGLSPISQPLANLKLAPRQYAAVGHSVTPGIKAIDAYLSCESMETPASDALFTERLVRLPGLGAYLERTKDFEPKPFDPIKPYLDRRIVFAGQELMKYRHADFRVIRAILERTKSRTLWVFIGVESPRINNAAKARFKQIFSGFDQHTYLFCDSRIPTPMFHGLLQKSHLMYNPVHWSGLNSILEGLEYDLPFLAYGAVTMRGRHAWGIAQELGLPHLQHETLEAYVDAHAKLLDDPAALEADRAELGARKDRLYEDRRVIEALHAELTRG